jgi:hypothetical protein
MVEGERGMIHVSRHAVMRYQERVANVSAAEVRAALTGSVFQLAVEQNIPFVKLGTGQHVVVRDGCIITVLPKDKYLGSFDRRRDIQFIDQDD